MEYVSCTSTENEEYMIDINVGDEIKNENEWLFQFENNDYVDQNKKVQNIIFIVSNPISMVGSKIATINSTLEEIIPELIEVSENNFEVEMRISIMSVSDCARWEAFVTKIDKDYRYAYLETSEAVEINALSAIELLRKDFIDIYNERKDFLQPVIFWFVDNKVNTNYTDIFRFIKGYKLFKNSINCGIAIGEDADRDFLGLVADEIITVHTPKVIKKFIRFNDIDDSIKDEEHNLLKIVYPQIEMAPVLRKLDDDGRARKFLCLYQGKEVVYRELYNSIITPDELYKEIKYKIDAGRIPGEWPIACTEIVGEKFGYLHDYISRQERNVGFDTIKARIFACRNVIKIYGVLHTKGFCFQHAAGILNFIVDYKTGDMKLTNVDEIMISGQHHGIGRNSRETAPELYWNSKPSTIESDRHSLAVFLFELLFDGHPFEGKKTFGVIMTEETKRKLYVDSPIYVWDYKDDTNRPLEHQNNGLVAPNYIMDAFSYSFSEDVVHQLNGKRRITEKEWFSLFKQWWNEMEDNK